MVERAHRKLKDDLTARMVAAYWYQHLPWVLLEINNSTKEDSRKLATEMVYGTSLTLPAKLASCSQEHLVEKILQKLATSELLPTRHGQKEVPMEPPAALAAADLVYLRKGSQLPPLE